MRWTDRLGRIAPLLVAILIASCTQPSPSPTASEAASSEPSAPASASQAASASAMPSAAAGPDRPYDGDDILTAMRTSPRPDGVPDELETDAIAAAIADEIWTIDGTPWDTMVIGATCGSDTCTVDVSGSREGIDGDDVWTFSVEPSTGEVTVGATDLRALPADVVTGLDMLARSLVDDAPLGAMALASASWLPPADANRFALSYRTGGEEGSCGVDLVIDTADETIVDEQTIGDC